MIRVIAAVLCGAGMLGLGFLGRQWFEAAAFQSRTAQALAAARGRAAPPPDGRGSGGDPAEADSVLARIEIPRIRIAAMIAAADDPESLQHGVGLIPGTARFGQAGNVGLAGHRDTFFRNLRSISIADTILVTTPRSDYRYLVDWTKVVTPDSVAVLAPADSALLTLVTCYPFHFVGPAPKRFVVRARRLDPAPGT